MVGQATAEVTKRINRLRKHIFHAIGADGQQCDEAVERFVYATTEWVCVAKREVDDVDVFLASLYVAGVEQGEGAYWAWQDVLEEYSETKGEDHGQTSRRN